MLADPVPFWTLVATFISAVVGVLIAQRFAIRATRRDIDEAFRRHLVAYHRESKKLINRVANGNKPRG